MLDIGVIAQNSTAKIENGDGVSGACAGVAGDGAVVGDVGESNCLTPGCPVGVNIANLDLTGVRLINPESALGALDPLLQPLADQLVGPLTRGRDRRARAALERRHHRHPRRGSVAVRGQPELRGGHGQHR